MEYRLWHSCLVEVDLAGAAHASATLLSAHQQRLDNMPSCAAGDGYASILASQSIYQSGDPLDQALGEYVLKRSPVRIFCLARDMANLTALT